MDENKVEGEVVTETAPAEEVSPVEETVNEEIAETEVSA